MYALTNNKNIIQRLTDGAFIPNDVNNGDYRAYEKWCAAGNKPLPIGTTSNADVGMPGLPYPLPDNAKGTWEAQLKASKEVSIND